jgi:hypothetical protein
MNPSIPKEFRLILRVIDVSLIAYDLFDNLQHQVIIFGFLLLDCQVSLLLLPRLLLLRFPVVDDLELSIR